MKKYKASCPTVSIRADASEFLEVRQGNQRRTIGKFQFALMRVSSAGKAMGGKIKAETTVSIRADASELRGAVAIPTTNSKGTTVSIRADASELLEGYWRVISR